jgi:alkylation response protein AidB-like acyl-CoA dehydrogenase
MPSPLQAARALRKTIDAGARTTDGATSVVADETVEAMTQAGLYGIMAPREVGGAELPLVEAIDVLAEVARADGSAGWCLMANASTVSLFGAYLDDAFIDEMFGAGVPRVAFGTNYGTAQPEDGGYRISGRYAFGSGIAHARWIGAGLIHPADPEQILFCALPADQAKILGNWDVMGLQETGSFDYAVNDVWVPEAATFPFVSPVRRRGGPVFELGVIPLTAAAHAGFAIGVVRRALDELAALARCKQRFGAASTLAENERFLITLGTLEGRARAAASWVHETYARAEDTVQRTGKPDPADVLALRQSAVHVTQDGADVVREAYLLAGTTALRSGPLARCFSDIHAGTQHYITGTIPPLELGRQLVEAAPDSALDAP